MTVDPQCREDYKRSFLAQLSSPNSSASLSSYLDAHNAYVTQLHATNGMVDQYNQYVLPQLLQVTVGSDHATTKYRIIIYYYIYLYLYTPWTAYDHNITI